MKENSIEKDEEILNNIKAYMQENIDKGWHKFVYNDLGYDEKCVDVINAIDNILSDYKRVLKENESLQKTYDDCYCKYKHYKQFESISIQKIKDKIRKNEEIIDISNDGDLIHELCKENKVLQELLEENENHISQID